MLNGDKVYCGYDSCDENVLLSYGNNPLSAEMLQHSITQGEAKEPTCSEAGWEAYEYCSNCSYTTKV